MDDAEKIIGRMCLIAGVKSLPELAKAWEISQSKLYYWQEKNIVKLEDVSEKLEGINLNWLMRGAGPMYSEAENVLREASPPGYEPDNIATEIGRLVIRIYKLLTGKK